MNGKDVGSEILYKNILAISAVVVGSLGFFVLLGWVFHVPSLVQIHPSFAPMQFNTALCFALTGVAFACLRSGRIGLASLCGIVIVLFGSLTLVQYLFNVDLGIDRTLFNKWLIMTRVTFPGRMSVLTALLFALTGIGILVASTRRGTIHPVLVGIPGVSVASVALVSLLGYALGVESNYGWGAFTRMAFHTAVGFVFVAAGLISIAVVLSIRREIRVIHWLPVTASLVLLFVLAIVTQQTLSEADTAADARKQAFNSLLLYSKLKESANNIQIGCRGFVITGDESFLDVHSDGLRTINELFTRISSYKGSSIDLQRLSANLESLAQWYKQLAVVRRETGFDAARSLVATGEGNKILASVSANIESLRLIESTTLAFQETEMRNGFQHSAILFASASAATLIMIATAGYWFAKEAKQRVMAEKAARSIAVFQSAIFNSANYAIVSTRVDGVVTTFNRCAYDLLVFSACYVIVIKTPALWHDESEVLRRAKELTSELGSEVRPGFDCFVAKAKLGVTDENEWTFIRKNGSRVPVLLSVTFIKEEDGRITGFLGVISDITLRKRAQQELASREALLRQLIAHTPAAIAMLDNDLRYLQVSERWLIDYHLENKEIIGKSHYEIFPDVPLRWKEIHRRVLEGVVERCDEDPFPRADGTSEWLQWECRPWRDAQGAIGGLIFFTQVITKRKLAEERLRQSEERFRNAVEFSAIGFALVDLDGRWLQVNRALCDLLHYSEPELMKMTFQDITHPSDLESDLNNVRRLLNGEISYYHMEKRYIDKYKNTIWVYLSVSLVRDSSGNPLYFVSQIQDISIRKQLEGEQRRLIQILEETSDYVGVADMAGNLKFHNRAARRMLGFPEDADLSSFKIEDMHPVWASKLVLEQGLPTVLEGKVWQHETAILHRNGREIPVSQVMMLHRDSQGQPESLSTIMRDITERKLSEMATLKNLREKEILLKEIHHRVKNNMQIVSSLLNLQASTVADHKFTQLIRQSQERISAMALVHHQLYQTTDLSRVKFQEYANQLCQALRLAYRDSAGATEIVVDVDDVELSIDQAIPCALITNEWITNAYKHAFPFGSSGEIKLSFRRTGDFFHLRVSDDGVGLPAGFNPDNLSSLGMTLVQTLTRQLGGSFSFVRDTETVFQVTFPAIEKEFGDDVC